MNKIFIYATLFILLFLGACKKEKNILKGNLSDMATNAPVANAEVNLYFSEVSSGVVKPAFSLLGTTTTDISGNYSFEFEEKMFQKFRLEFLKEEYHNKTIEFEPKSIIATYEKNEKIAKESYLKLYIVNPYKIDNNITVLIDNVNSLCDFCCSGPFYYSGAEIDETGVSHTCPIVGGENITVRIYQKNELNENVGSASQNIIAPIGDTAKTSYILVRPSN